MKTIEQYKSIHNKIKTQSTKLHVYNDYKLIYVYFKKTKGEKVGLWVVSLPPVFFFFLKNIFNVVFTEKLDCDRAWESKCSIWKFYQINYKSIFLSTTK